MNVSMDYAVFVLTFTLCMSISGSYEELVTICRKFNPETESLPECEGETVTLVRSNDQRGGLNPIEKETIQEITKEIVNEFTKEFSTRLSHLSERVKQLRGRLANKAATHETSVPESRCRVPNAPHFGYVSPNVTKVSVGVTITYTCNEGYDIGQQRANQLTATCKPDLTWTQGPPTCQDNAEDGKYYVWSDNRADANSARQSCSSKGGRLAQIEDKSQNDGIRTLMQQNYNEAHLGTVQVYENPDISRAFKYRGPGSQDPANITGWNRPSRGNLTSFKLFERATGNFSSRARFCYYPGRDAYRKRCDLGWIFNFDLFGGALEAENTIILRHAFTNLPTSSRFMLPGRPIPEGYLMLVENDRNYPTLSIPDNSVFIGARSDVNETSWYWSDGTKVTDTDYPTSNASVCQQMSWPLTYDDGINLLPKRCDDRAYFACEYKCRNKVMN